MKFKIIIITYLLLLISPINKVMAQDDNFPRWMIGAKTGINISNKYDDKLWGTKTGYNVGLVVDYNLTSVLFLRSGASWTTKGAIAKNSSKGMLNDASKGMYIHHKKSTLEYDLNYLHIPVNVGVRIELNDNCAVNIASGFYVEYGMKMQTTLKKSEKNIYIEDNNSTVTSSNKIKNTNWKQAGLKRYDVGVNLTGEFEFRNIVAGFTYESSMMDIEKKSPDKSLFETWKNRNGTFTIGYKFAIK